MVFALFCTQCPSGTIPLVPCSLQDDTKCTNILDVGLVMSGVDYWSLPTSIQYPYIFSDESEIVAQLIECEDNQFRDQESNLCTACSTCIEPYETEIKPCTNSTNRVCKSIIQVDLSVWDSAGIEVDKRKPVQSETDSLQELRLHIRKLLD